MLKNRHFEVKVKKDEKNAPEPPRYILTPEDITVSANDIVYSIGAVVIGVKVANTLLRMAEHIVVTKVK